MYPTRHLSLWLAVFVLGLATGVAGTLDAQTMPDPSCPEERHPDLDIRAFHQELDELPAAAAAQAHQRLATLGVDPSSARVDRRSGRFVTLLATTPLTPGPGVGNDLDWADLGLEAPASRGERERAAWQAFRGYLAAHQDALGIDPGELAPNPTVTVHDDGDLVQIYAPRLSGGIPVRGSYVSAVIRFGNLILLGTHKWGDRVAADAGALSKRPDLTRDEAVAAAREYLAPLTVSGEWGKPEEVYLPLANDQSGVAYGRGYRYLRAWSVKLNVEGDEGNWEVLVDATSGEILANEDRNAYGEVKGGVYPVTNDGVVPDGVEQAGWPMPFADVGAETTDTGGNFTSSGTVTTDFYGPYVDINDFCGTSSLSGSGVLDWGTSEGTDCATPGFGGAGNTHASRTGFYELNKMIEMARGQLPGNSWLQSRLTANVNLNNFCNAFWDGATVNFFATGGGCSNTGEIVGVLDHEWGHGMDANDATPGLAGPSGEGIADIYAALRLNDSCIGRNFRPGVVCSGDGDPCLTCTGARDIDYLKRQSGQPHDYSWSNDNCCGRVHCVGHVYSEAVWSLWKRKLRQAPYGYDNNTAWEVTNRLTFLGAGATGTWFSGVPPNGGCGGSSGYMNYLAIDDDNGNLNDGTPHMAAIYEAFNDQEIACGTPTVQDSGCAGVPTTAPSVIGTASDMAVDLGWNVVAGATHYSVFRTEGVFACDFGKVKLGETTGTTWSDTGLRNGRQYSYIVIPMGGNDACFGPASACTSVTPAAGPGLTIDTGSASTSISGGDGDIYLDNCEDATTSFTVTNTGLGTLTGVRIVGVVASSPGVTLTTSFPAAISPATLGVGATGNGSFSYSAGGLAPGETLILQVEVTADEMTASKLADLTVSSTEIDLTFIPSVTYSFESDAEGWTTVQGTFGRSSSGGGADDTAWYERSSANLDDRCDQIQSPVVVFSATTTLTLWSNYDIEPQYNGEWYDRANVGLVVGGSRSLVTPDGGRPYNASGPQGTCGTYGQGGWADAATTWGPSAWSAGALGAAGLAGQEVRIDIRYGTDDVVNGDGFRFDEVTVTDVSLQGDDTQNDTCGCTSDEECDDGAFCNGAETCVAGSCQAGTPVDCDDGISCTVDSCNEGTDSCDNIPTRRCIQTASSATASGSRRS